MASIDDYEFPDPLSVLTRRTKKLESKPRDKTNDYDFGRTTPSMTTMVGGGFSEESGGLPLQETPGWRRSTASQQKRSANKYVNFLLSLPKPVDHIGRMRNKKRAGKQAIQRIRYQTHGVDELHRRNKNKADTLRKVREMQGGLGTSAYRQMGDLLNWTGIGEIGR